MRSVFGPTICFIARAFLCSSSLMRVITTPNFASSSASFAASSVARSRHSH
eukprot:TRINITY_DN33028_c0_g1_i1.p5 TRINITY_DN33028_c0_g1~~TRINITY_DN33028_c0_g1_i1.p5  ORF type:complete len:51 (+),score=13.52 TRINITY_DN33028_c0_g1_i1:99-251(+)